MAEKRLIEMDVKLGGTKLKLAEVESLNLAQADKIAELKWYNEGFTNVENSVEPLSIKPGDMDSREDGWPPCKPWECHTILN